MRGNFTLSVHNDVIIGEIFGPRDADPPKASAGVCVTKYFGKRTFFGPTECSLWLGNRVVCVSVGVLGFRVWCSWGVVWELFRGGEFGEGSGAFVGGDCKSCFVAVLGACV